MGGTLIRLAEQGHEVHIAYQTSGNIAVFDDDVVRCADFVEEFVEAFDIPAELASKIIAEMQDSLQNKQPGQVDSDAVQTVKGIIRRGEARSH